MEEVRVAGGIFVIVEVERVYDPPAALAYQRAARGMSKRRGCKILARGGTVFEGQAQSQSHLIQWWESEKAFRDWQGSDEYLPLKEKRDKAMKLRITIVPAEE